MSRPIRRAVRIAAAVLCLGCCACGSGSHGTPPPRCDECHDLDALVAGRSELPPREWMSAQGRGLVRRTVLAPTDRTDFGLEYPGRGNHASTSLGGCPDCHPTSGQGLRHGIRQYPPSSRASAFAPGTDCAPACHGWLAPSVASTGFAPATGAAPQYSGSIRPHDLLTGAGNAHARIYREGYAKAEGDHVSVERIGAGCAGCHNVRDEWHGTTSLCLDCHRFGGTEGEVHVAHVAAIEARRAQTDPGHAAEPACNYCHGFGAERSVLGNAACYNCHLGGHQPLDAGGGAHFWP